MLRKKTLTYKKMVSFNFGDKWLYQNYVFSVKKNEVFFSFFDYSLLYPFTFFYCVNLLENRFWLYNKWVSLESKKYVFSLKKSDLSKGYCLNVFRSFGALSSLSIKQYNLRKYVLCRGLGTFCSKTIPVLLTKTGYVLRFYGLNAFLLRNLLSYKSVNNCSYTSWFVYNLHFLGVLSLFKLIRWVIFLQKKPGLSNIYSIKDQLFSLCLLEKF